MADFPHLPLPQKIQAPLKYKRPAFSIKKSEVTISNLINKRGHGKELKNAISEYKRQWEETAKQRRDEGLPEIPRPWVKPLFFKVDPTLFTADDLYSFGIEVIAETESGFIIGATTGADGFTSLESKIEKFAKGKAVKAAQLWDIINGTQWRLDYILSQDLEEKWDQITDNQILVVDVSIACDFGISDAPSKNRNESERSFRRRYENWKQKKESRERQRDEEQDRRQQEFQRYTEEIGSNLILGFVDYNDSFGCRLELSGKALKDLVLNYQYLFDVTEYNTLSYTDTLTSEVIDFQATINPPPANGPKICIIDSGIQEGHRLLSPAIDSSTSRCYLPGSTSTVDEVGNGGHGTKVAGAALYGSNIPKGGVYDTSIWIRNARVLNSDRKLHKALFPPLLMERIVNDFGDCKVFNLSITENRAYRMNHMSQWASTIDKIVMEKDVLFIIAAGNIQSETDTTNNPGIKNHLAAGRNYPDYLLERASRIANPAQSCFAITVSSICCSEYVDEDKVSFGGIDEPSSFTRTGPGIWQMVKPDVVEYGGDFIREKQDNPNLTQLSTTSPELVRTSNGGSNALGYDIGSSYAAPKVSHIAGMILKQIPKASSNLIRVLIAQSARLPGDKLSNPSYRDICWYGYGIPNETKATQNSERRITLVAEDYISAKEAQAYTIRIPSEIIRPGNDYKVLIEVTLAFRAGIRRTRRQTKSYLSTWADWQSSKLRESAKDFRGRVSEYIDQDVSEIDDKSEAAEGTIKWNIRERADWGLVKDIKRQDSSLQKDWAILNAYDVPKEFSIAVIGHKGWEKDIAKRIPYALALSFEVLEADVNIYNLIRIENQIEVEVRT